MGQDTEAVREKIDRMHKKIEDTSYYDLLGVDPEMDEAQLVREATNGFRELAKEWHVDRYDTDSLGGDAYREKLQEIFSAINNARQVLTNEEKRTEYDMKLSGENTDIGALLNAENAFRKGQSMLDTGAYSGAHKQFEIACQENPDDIEYRAHYLYTEFLLLPKDGDGNPEDRRRTKEIYDEMDKIVDEIPDRAWILTFLGVIAMGLSSYREAGALFNEALQINPKSVTAKRQKRLLKMKMKRAQNKGFFAKLMDKFK